MKLFSSSSAVSTSPLRIMYLKSTVQDDSSSHISSLHTPHLSILLILVSDYALLTAVRCSVVGVMNMPVDTVAQSQHPNTRDDRPEMTLHKLLLLKKPWIDPSTRKRER
jgi:hypothetical protein